MKEEIFVLVLKPNIDFNLFEMQQIPFVAHRITVNLQYSFKESGTNPNV